MDMFLAWTKAERLDLADFLDDLGTAEWDVPSLCAGWTVRDVAAHLALSTSDTLLGTITGMIRARGDWNRMNATAARDWARRCSPAELVAQLREIAGSARRSPGAGPLDPLVDLLVHGQDMARPLGRTWAMDPRRAAAALDHVLSSRFYGARRQFRGLRLVATDTDWSAGASPDEVRGPVADLLLVATGRAAGLAALSGPGAERIQVKP
ncbi:TIGR03083 family protein [Amycolatopsis arida]|uniref:TIGR03083 family protein n=1 Tax=Amycolatopsis arida TaxID=587909 RepID=A0A1I5KQ53_9PSEU|nr:maleylpyruvate isomerase family mycothiol-dependent enzyme [Amycolatopsis arida]TDX97133.1 uncharacterized protein (TIGR03083 family) [Amycolatopsis arida]SFO86621.1 TIGR03083 family protein [Amycolatopsis arida]